MYWILGERLEAAKLTKLPMLPIGSLMRPKQLFNPDRERIAFTSAVTPFIPRVFLCHGRVRRAHAAKSEQSGACWKPSYVHDDSWK